MIRGVITSTVLLLALLLLSGCTKPEPKVAEQKRELRTITVATAEIRTYIEASGTIQADPQGSAKIVPHLPGVVTRIFVKVGDRVAKGQPLVAITSPEITDAFSSHLSTLSQVKQAERIFNLNKQLFEIGAVTKNDLINSEASLEQLRSVLSGIRGKLRIYGVTPEGVKTTTEEFNDRAVVNAPVAGAVSDIQCHVGDRVDTSSQLLMLTDPNNIVLVMNIYDTDVPKIKQGRDVLFTIASLPDRTFRGRITYISDVSDTEAKTVKTFVNILDKKDAFKQNMFIRVRIEGEKRVLPIVPQSAIVYKDGKFYVYCRNADSKQCDLRQIKPVQEMPDKTMAVTGINAGEQIVLTAIELEKP